MSKIKQPNELFRDLMGVNGLNPWDGYDSSSRKQMFSSHIGQTLVIKGSSERRCQTGMEREYAKYTFSVKMPVDAEIIKVIERYPRTQSVDSINFNPETAVIYEDERTKEVGLLMLKGYCSHHSYFGFEYKNQPALSQLSAGGRVKAGTILQDSPSVTPDGGYKYGRECNMAFMSHPAVSEDGILISRDVLPHFSFKTYETRVAEWGEKRFPLNLYGDETTYKPFPDIGDYIREDGLLMALRSFDDNLAVVEQSVTALRKPDFIFDKLIYVAGAGDREKRSGRVVDIRVHHDSNSAQPTTPTGMDTQALKYDRARRQFYSAILHEYHRLRKQRAGKLVLTPEFHRMVVEAISVVGDNKGSRLRKLYRQAPLDDWRVEFVVEYNVTPTVGFKLTDCHGGKGVVCHVAEPHEMPVDEAGNRADVVMDPNSTISRMNIGRLYEQYINAASRDVVKRLREIFQLEPTDPQLLAKLKQAKESNPALWEDAWSYLMGYYQIVSPKMFVWLTSDDYTGDRAQHLFHVLKEGIYLYLPPENDPEGPEMIRQLEKAYRPTYGPVSYIGNSGRRVTTINPVRIGSVYMILLEKTGDDWTAVSSGKLQHFGVLSQVTNADKFSQPTRNQAIRALGESEVRIYTSYAGPAITADILDRNNNPATHRQILESILHAEKPTDIANSVNRDLVPLGGSKPLQLVKHILEIQGIRFVYKPHTS